MITRKWKKVALLGALMGTCFTAGVYAQDVVQRVDAYLRSDFKIVVNGEPITLDHPTLVYNDSSYLPLKELAGYLGATVNWQGETQTIYINSKISAEQTDGNVSENYPEFTLTYPYAYNMQYLGGVYPVLMNMSDKTYYRVKDVTRMGIDTNGLQKVREKYTGELYVSESELRLRWKETPAISYATTSGDMIIITGETDSDKIAAIRSYVETTRSYKLGDTYYYITPVIIDKLPEENTYSYLLTENNHYYRTTMRLSKFVENGDYLVASSAREDLEAGK